MSDPAPPRDDTTGPCALCHQPTLRYGPQGRPLCAECEASVER